MKWLKKENERVSTLLAFALIPISGFAIDIYIPSFPEMAQSLHATPAGIKLTMTFFLISYGITQLFGGSLLDSYGRYKINMVSLFLFTASNVAIIASPSLHFIYLMRLLQGVTIAMIVMAKRSFFIDVYTGEKRKQYTSLVTVVWSTAPILAPFVGGYLQKWFGWKANFYFLAIYGFLFLLLELKYSGETLREMKPFRFTEILNAYRVLLTARDFTFGIFVLGLSYSMVMVFGMSIPFIVEHQFHLSPVVTGYCALCSGIAIFMGGFWSRLLIDKPFYRKVALVNLGQLIIATTMLLTSSGLHHLWSIMLFVVLLHLLQGFTYNSYFTYCLTKYPAYAATTGGISSGGSYIVFSVSSYLITNMIDIKGARPLSISYIIFLAAIALLLLIVRKDLQKAAS